jgi:hypothetical protein
VGGGIISNLKIMEHGCFSSFMVKTKSLSKENGAVDVYFQSLTTMLAFLF